MENQKRASQIKPAVRELYPTLTEAELKEAEANLRRYVEIAVAIQQEQAAADFDRTLDPTTMRERSNANLKS